MTFRIGRVASLVLVSLAVIALPRVTRAEKYKVFVLAGQSNMTGHGLASELPAEYQTPREDVKFASEVISGNKVPTGPVGDTWGPLKTGSATYQKQPAIGPEIGFGFAMADAMKQMAPDAHVAVIKFARSGANLREQFSPTAKQGLMLYPAMIAFIKEQLDYLRKDGNEIELAGFGWYQGEADTTGTEEDAKAFNANLKGLIAAVRKDLNAPELPFIACRVHPNLERHVHREIVRKAIVDVTESDGHAAWVDVDDLTYPDNLHLDAKSQIEAGKRMVQAWLKITGHASSAPATKP
jgi:iduronate 2-sulfatase